MTLVEKMKEFEANTEWVDTHYQELRATYPDEYVAVWTERVVGHSNDLPALMNTLETMYPQDYRQIPVEYISTEDVHLILKADP
jgi:hypothetical protein